MNETQTQPSFNRLILGTVSVFAFAIILGESYAWWERRIPGDSAPWLSALIVNFGIALAATLAWWKRREWGLVPPARWPQLGGPVYGAGTFLAYLPSIVVLAGAMLLGLASPLFGVAERSFTFSNTQWLFILVVPAVEEWAFRVGAGGYFRRICGPFWGGYMSAMLFSLVHSLPTWSRVMEMKIGLLPGPLLLGLFCEILLIGSGRVLPGIALHMACNATVVIFTVTDERWLRWLDFLYVGR